MAKQKDNELLSALNLLDPGSTVLFEKPDGNLRLNFSSRPIVFIAGGMGVASIYSMIQSIVTEGIPRAFTLFYSNKSDKNIIFLNELEKIKRSRNNFQLFLTFTKQKSSYPDALKGRINVSLLQEKLGDLSTSDYYIAGSEEMVLDLQNKLQEKVVMENQIFKETFNAS